MELDLSTTLNSCLTGEGLGLGAATIFGAMIFGEINLLGLFAIYFAGLVG
ncbi:hypothetical protein [Mucilaginibacter sp.]